MKYLIGGLALVIVTQPVSAQSPATPAAPPARPNCSGPEYRELDFWTGEWNVFDTAKGFHIATSRVERLMKDCTIKESYDAPNAPGGAYAGTSYSGYSRLDHKWHQMYVDLAGNVGLYVGGREGPDMVLFAPTRGGATLRMTYHPNPDGTVQQIGFISTDGGKTWQPGYDYTYRRK